MKQHFNIISISIITILLPAFIMPAKLLAQRPELIIPATHRAGNVVISPDEKWLVSAGRGIKIWDNKTNKLLKNLEPGSKDNSRFENGVAMAFNPQSNMLAMQIADTMYFFDFDKFAIINKVKISTKITSIVFDAEGKNVFIAGYKENGGDNNFIEKINSTNGSPVDAFCTLNIKTLASHYLDNLSVSNNGKELLVYDAVMGSWIINIETQKISKTFKETGNVYPYKYLSNGNIIAFAGKNEKVLYLQELDSKTYLPLRKSKVIFKDEPSDEAMYYTRAFSSRSDKIILHHGNDFTFFNPVDFSITPKKRLQEFNGISVFRTDITVAPSGDYYVIGGNMKKYNINNSMVLAILGELPLDSYVQFVFKGSDGICLKDRILKFDNGVFNLRLVNPVSITNDYGFLYRLTADGKTGFIYNDEWGLYRFDPTKAKPEYESVAKINSMRKKFVGMQIFDDLNLLALIGNEGIFVLDLKTLRVLYIVDIPYGLEYSRNERLNKFCDISPDNTKMILFAEAVLDKETSKEVFGDTTNFIYCVDLSDRNPKWSHASVNIQNLRFVENGKKLFFTSNDKLIYLDAETGKQVGAAVQLPKSEFETIISPSGTIAATQVPVDANISAGSDIGLVNVVNRKAIGTMQGTGDDVNGFVFLHNERYMLTEEYGGLCLWDLDKKRKIGKIYMFEGNGDWVMVTDDGRFDATEGALKKMYFAKGKEIIPLESLYEKYYVPGLLKQIWDNTLPNNVPDIADINSPPLIKITLQTAERNLDVADDVKTISVDKEQVTIKAEADGLKDVVTEIRLYQNGKLVHTTRNLTVEDENKGDKTMTKTFSVTLNTGQNNFKAVALNSQRTESVPAELIADYKPLIIPVKTKENDIQLYLFVVGVNAYKNPKYTLNYAQADAASFIEAITTGSQGLFGKINTTVLKDAEATKEGMSAAFEKIKAAAHPQDLFIFYYAGHGVVNDKKEFFLVPYDVTQLYGNDGALAQKGFSAAALQQMSKDIKAQKQLFILDACQSAGALEVVAGARGAAEEKAIAQLARSTGTQWLTASGSEQFASEFSQLGHGAFTYCLLEAFKGDANPTDKKLTVKQLDAYLQTKVPEITQKYKGTPQYPASYSYGNDFPIIIIK